MSRGYDAGLAEAVPYVPQMAEGGVAEARAMVEEMSAGLPPFELSDNLVLSTEAVPVDGLDDPVTVHTLRPTSADETAAPAVLWFHGGGFILGDALMDLPALAEMAQSLNATVFSVEYALSPEATYPTAVNQGYAVLNWIATHADELSVDPNRIAVGGTSAGACLAAAVTLMSRDRGGPRIRFQGLDIPVTDNRLDTSSMMTMTDTPLWSRAAATYSWEAYLGHRTNGDVPAYASPARADDLSGLPPTYISVCEFDPLRDEGMAYAQRLVQAGVSTELHLFPGTFHGSAASIRDAEISVRMRTEFVSAIARAFA